MNEKYIRKLTELLNRKNIDAALVCPSEELVFFTGFSPYLCERFQGLFIKKDGTMFYFCNLLTGDEVKSHYGDAFPIYTWFDNDIMLDKLEELLKKEGLCGKTIAVNSTAQAFNVLDIAEKCEIRFINGVALLEETRICKTEEELACMRKAASIADQGFINTIPQLHAGMTEKEIFDILTGEMTKLGGDHAGALIASGPNASYPHYCSYGRTIQPGDSIIMDFGCFYKGLQSDMTRTIFVSYVPERSKELYELLRQAQEYAESCVKEGAYIPDIDAAARKILAKKQLDGACTTRVGHGIGYMTHEAPYINSHNFRHLEKGMCFSIEPGIYLSGDFGARIEDIVCINLEGECEVLNKAPKDIIVIS